MTVLGTDGVKPDVTQEIAGEDILEVANAVNRGRAESPETLAVVGTQEIEVNDVLEVQVVAQRLEAPPPSGGIFDGLPRRNPLPPLNPPPRALMVPRALSLPPPSPSQYPNSLAPIALDVSAPQGPRVESTMQIRRSAGIPDRARPTLAIAGALAACVAILVALGAFGLARHKASSAAQQVLAPPPAAQAQAAIKDEVPEPPLLLQKTAVDNADSNGVHAPVPARAVGEGSARSAFARQGSPATAKPPTPKTSAVQNGSLRFPVSVNGVLVDGTPRKVVGGAIVLKCGKHKVKLPRQPARGVDVPCGKTLSLS